MVLTLNMTIRNLSVEVRCEDGEDPNGAWTVIQRRGQFGNRENLFNKLRYKYENGFGNLDGGKGIN